MLVGVAQCTRQSPSTSNYLAPNVKHDKVIKPRFRQVCCRWKIQYNKNKKREYWGTSTLESSDCISAPLTSLLGSSSYGIFTSTCIKVHLKSPSPQMDPFPPLYSCGFVARPFDIALLCLVLVFFGTCLTSPYVVGSHTRASKFDIPQYSLPFLFLFVVVVWLNQIKMD